MIDGYAYSGYSSLIGLDKEPERVNGFDTDGRLLPSERFYTGKVGAATPSPIEEMWREPTIAELKADIQELQEDMKNGHISEEQFKLERKKLRAKIEKIRDEKNGKSEK